MLTDYDIHVSFKFDRRVVEKIVVSKRSSKEMMHMQRLFTYVNETGALAMLGQIDAPPTDFASVADLFEKIYEHECLITSKINDLADAAFQGKDYSTFNFLQWYVAEQHEEEALFKGILERGVKQELFAHFVLITLNRIFATKVEEGFTENDALSPRNETADSRLKFKVNLKNALVTLARNLEGLFIRQAGLVKTTVNNIVDSISRCRQKERPNRNYQRQSKKPIKKWRPSHSKEKKSTQPMTA